MAGRGKVGEAFVEIVADYAAFIKTAPAKLQAALKQVGAKVTFDPLAEEFGRAGQQAAREYGREFERQLDRDTTRTRRLARDRGRGFVSTLLRGTDEESRRRGNAFTRIFRFIGNNAIDGFQAGFRGVGAVGSGIFGGIRDAFGAITGGIGGFIGDLKGILPVVGSVAVALGKLIFIPVLVSSVYALGSALVSLSGVLLTLPGALGAFGLALGTVLIAFSGFSDAVSAFASGDAKKIEEAIKGLPPAMRDVAREVGTTVVPAFKQIRETVQQNFFTPLRGAAKRLTETLGPVARAGFGALATVLGRLGATIANKLASPRGQRFLTRLFDTSARIANQFGPTLLRLFSALGSAFETSLPYVEMLFRLMGKGIDHFSEWLKEQSENGSLEDFLLSALETGRDFMGVISALIDLFGALFEDTEEGGQSFLEHIKNALKTLAEFFRSPEGRKALKTMIDLAVGFGKALVVSVAVLLKIIGTLADLWRAAKRTFNAIVALIDKSRQLSGVGSAIRSAAGALARAGLAAFAEGGIVERPTVALVGEAGREAVVPLTNPRRAREVMDQAGLTSLAAGMGDGDTTVLVYLGTREITDIIGVEVDRKFKRQGQVLTQGVRT